MIDEAEPEMERAVRAAFEFERDTILDYLETFKAAPEGDDAEAKKLPPGSRAMEDIRAFYKGTIGTNWRTQLVGMFQHAIVGDLNKYQSAYTGLRFDIQNVEGMRWFHSYAMKFADPINQYSLDELRDVIGQATYEGWSIDLTQHRIGIMFDYWIDGNSADLTQDDYDWVTGRHTLYRRELIARDQIMRMSNVGTFELIKQGGAPFKEWLATADDRTRDSHTAAFEKYREGGTVGPIPVDEPFILDDGSRVMHPGDDSLGAPLYQIIQCRCTALPFWGDDSGGQPPGDTRTDDQIEQDIEEAEEEPDRIPGRGELGAELRQKLEDYAQELAAEINNMSVELEAVEEQLRKTPRFTPEAEKLIKKAADLSADIGHKKFARIQQMREMLEVPESERPSWDPLNVRGVAKPAAFKIRTWEGSLETLRSWTSTRYRPDYLSNSGKSPMEPTVRVNQHNSRESFTSTDMSVNASDKTTASTIIHEFGHWLEYSDPDLQDAAITYLQNRTRNEVDTKLKDLTGNPGYRDDEVCRPDKFKSPYMGKIYYKSRRFPHWGIRSTELISMGVEEMYADPYRFAQEDPDYFDFIIDSLRGIL